MAWTSPKTWNTNDLVTANDLNQQLRDNLNHLYSLSNTANAGDLNANLACYSSSPIQIGTYSVTLTTVGRPVLLIFSATAKSAAGGTVYFQWYKSGSPSVALGLPEYSGLSTLIPVELSIVHQVGAGTHTWFVAWNVATATAAELYRPILFAVEL